VKYSFVTPRKKSVINAEMKLMFSFFGITIFMLTTTYAFLLYKDYKFVGAAASSVSKQTVLKETFEDMKGEIEYIQKQNLLATRVQTKNAVLKDSIANLFDLVPENITLSQAQLGKNSLILHGITPNKDVYNFMLQAPLRSIFHRTYSSFYPAGNGWLRFVSSNYTNEELVVQTDDEEEEDEDEEIED